MTTPEETLAALRKALCYASPDGASAIDAHITARLREHLASPPPAGREVCGHASGLDGDGPPCVKPSEHESPWPCRFALAL